jgi:hypothetical protein
VRSCKPSVSFLFCRLESTLRVDIWRLLLFGRHHAMLKETNMLELCKMMGRKDESESV